MSEKIRKHFQEKRDEFDVEMPPLDLWKNIEQKLEAPNIELESSEHRAKDISNEASTRSSSKLISLSKMSSYWRAAAILLLTFGLGFFAANWYSGHSGNSHSALAQQEGPSLEEIIKRTAPEMMETENFYLTSIHSYTNELKSYKNLDQELVAEFLEEHENLDKIYNELKKMLLENADNQQIINLMVQNLQMRMSILQKQKTILQSIQEQKSDNNGKTEL